MPGTGMDTWTGTRTGTEEARQLRVCINDLLSLLALPAMWSGRNAPQIMGSLLDSLLGMLRLDLTYARLHDPEGAPPTDALRTAQRLQSHLPHELGRILDDRLAAIRLRHSFRSQTPSVKARCGSPVTRLAWRKSRVC
ncbi:MAG: hypothetical protein ACT4OT_15220 [Acidobacteriota bacterium]